MLKKIFLIFLLLTYISSFVFAENWVLISHLDDTEEPEPYEKEEFPEWAWYLRRFEVMLFGSLPIVYILTSFAYDLFYFAYSSGEDGFGTHREQQDLLNMVIITASISGVIAIADLIISLVKGGKEKRAENAAQSLSISW